ncbi:MAG: SMC-Scp complex subunit ScpB, partial [Proteobacteria bacterium]|nr:SMC-Scp complex subunit ScpB [Pseudomonadota bacterium]
YTRALLETMALIAYRQPITRGEIEEVRGVSVSSNIIKTLLERDWIKVLGHKDVPGKPTLYGTTKEFLDYFNLQKLDQLPTLAEIKDLDSIHPELELDDDVSNETDGSGADGSDANNSDANDLDTGDQGSINSELDQADVSDDEAEASTDVAETIDAVSAEAEQSDDSEEDAGDDIVNEGSVKEAFNV